LLAIIWVGIGVAALFSRDGRVAGVFILAVYAVGWSVFYVLVRFTGWGRQEWNSYLQPFRDIWHLVGG
jgi:hypothetical protein